MLRRNVAGPGRPISWRLRRDPAKIALRSVRFAIEDIDMLHWLWVFLIGLVIGMLAKLITPGREPSGCIITGFLGIGGSLLATWAGERLGLYGPGQSAGFIASVIGAVVILLLYQALVRSR
jgi:uncharacterized membrane protein YeaQ/YmgE (transglycosylase-associated protein family)